MNAPDEIFAHCAEQFSVEDLIEQKTSGYEIPSSVLCIMRVHNIRTNKVTEHVYQQRLAATKRLGKELEVDDPVEITVLSDDHFYVVANFDPDDNESGADCRAGPPRLQPFLIRWGNCNKGPQSLH